MRLLNACVRVSSVGLSVQEQGECGPAVLPHGNRMRLKFQDEALEVFGNIF